MAISITDLVVHNLPSAGSDFYLGASSADASGGEEVLAAVAGASHYVRKIIIKCTPAAASVITVTILSATTEVLELVPFSGDAGAELVLDFGRNGIKFGLGEAINISASAAGIVFAYVEGRTCKYVN